MTVRDSEMGAGQSVFVDITFVTGGERGRVGGEELLQARRWLARQGHNEP